MKIPYHNSKGTSEQKSWQTLSARNMNPLPASIDKHTVEAEDDEPVLLEEKTVREIPKTRTPAEDPVDTSDPAQFGADIFLMITAFAVMTACLPFMKKKRRQ